MALAMNELEVSKLSISRRAFMGFSAMLFASISICPALVSCSSEPIVGTWKPSTGFNCFEFDKEGNYAWIFSNSDSEEWHGKWERCFDNPVGMDGKQWNAYRLIGDAPTKGITYLLVNDGDMYSVVGEDNLNAILVSGLSNTNRQYLSYKKAE